jgi:hypothetical protein
LSAALGRHLLTGADGFQYFVLGRPALGHLFKGVAGETNRFRHQHAPSLITSRLGDALTWFSTSHCAEDGDQAPHAQQFRVGVMRCRGSHLSGMASGVNVP